ncbi:MAG: DUF1657 domain-containing protein [Syntrophomonadaceae bacterium]|nr:DUF1657 domain-containing protein [Syntrophomonadaceae bacterium]
MTVASQVKQTVASLKGARATLENMASIEKTPATRNLLRSNTEKLNLIIERMEQRVGELERQEPQYSGL